MGTLIYQPSLHLVSPACAAFHPLLKQERSILCEQERSILCADDPMLRRVVLASLVWIDTCSRQRR